MCAREFGENVPNYSFFFNQPACIVESHKKIISTSACDQGHRQENREILPQSEAVHQQGWLGIITLFIQADRIAV